MELESPRPTKPAPPPARPTKPVPPPADLIAASAAGPVDQGSESDVDLACDASGVYQAQFTEADLLARSGSMAGIPVVQKTLAQIRALPLDPVSGFLLSVMDGTMSVEMLIDLSAIPREEVVRGLCLLADHDVISFVVAGATHTRA